MRAQPEALIREQLAKWFQLRYPGVIPRFDLAGDLKLTMGQATRMKRINPFRGYPDLWISEPRGGYHGMYLEIKASDVKVFKANGELYADPHLAEQWAMIQRLRDKGYWADFGIGLEMCITKCSDYLGGKLRPNEDDVAA